MVDCCSNLPFRKSLYQRSFNCINSLSFIPNLESFPKLCIKFDRKAHTSVEWMLWRRAITLQKLTESNQWCQKRGNSKRGATQPPSLLWCHFCPDIDRFREALTHQANDKLWIKLKDHTKEKTLKSLVWGWSACVVCVSVCVISCVMYLCVLVSNGVWKHCNEAE